jgi:uncharacterized protein YlxW (UPF0749 family)
MDATRIPSTNWRTAYGSWLGPITVMTFVLGALIGLALKTQDRNRADNLPSSTYAGLAEAYLNQRVAIADQTTISGLERQNEQLTNAIAQGSPRLQTLNQQLNDSKAIAGLTPVYGPGIIVTLQDSPHYKNLEANPTTLAPQQATSQMLLNFIIHDVDIQRVLNELKAGGAEAFAVNSQRVIATTAVRCVGPAIQVNGVPITPPYKITVVGDPGTLAGALELPGGIADQLRSADPAMIAVAKSNKVTLPAYRGATDFRYAHPIFQTDSGSN